MLADAENDENYDDDIVNDQNSSNFQMQGSHPNQMMMDEDEGGPLDGLQDQLENL